MERQIRGMEILEENRHIAVTMEEVLASYESLVNMDDLTRADQPCIFEIPKTLYRHNETVYLPNAFSFGPLHCGKPDLEAAQAIKFKFLRDTLRVYADPRTKLAELEKAVYGRLVQARQCYAKQVEVLNDDEKFVKILVLDGCFIINLFLMHGKQYEYCRFKEPVSGLWKCEPEIKTAHLLQCLYHDLILLENQIPWFVLELLSDLLFEGDKKLTLRQAAIGFFRSMFSHDGLRMPITLLEQEKVMHILDLLRNSLFLSFLGDDEKEVQSSGLLNMIRFLLLSLGMFLVFPIWVLMLFCNVLSMFSRGNQGLAEYLRSPRRLLFKFLQKLSLAPGAQVPDLEMQVPSASRLREAGVKFKRGRLRLAIKFQKGVLEIPSLLIHDTTETVFRNLIAFEQCYRDCPPVVTSYARFMDNLIDTVEDIDILHKNGIICSSLNPEDATKFFNSLYNDTYVRRSHYAFIYGEVNRYCQRWWPRWRAFYIHNYFGKPWAIFSQVFALLILALTILQVLHK